MFLFARGKLGNAGMGSVAIGLRSHQLAQYNVAIGRCCICQISSETFVSIINVRDNNEATFLHQKLLPFTISRSPKR